MADMYHTYRSIKFCVAKNKKTDMRYAYQSNDFISLR